MPDELIINKEALEPLFSAWEEPSRHRVKAEDGAGAKIVQGRRRSGITIAQNLRSDLREWRDSFYAGASETSRHLLDYWFNRGHRLQASNGEEFEFRYYYCQREATEALIYLKEVKQIETLSQLINEYGGPNREIEALGVTESEDLWSRYAFKLATGAGKTKCMSLAVVWSYFHAVRESDSPMARNFVVVAPNLTVFERLKEDFKPEDGGPDIFDKDPLIPPEWRGDWNLSTVLQDEASGAATGGTLYLTNIHRLYDVAKRRAGKDAAVYGWMGPPVSKNTALDTGKELRERVTSHNRILVLNDEAHHVWDPDSAWNEAIEFLYKTIRSKTGGTGELVAQLDFSATPKDNKGQVFKHVIVDTPLGEAVDSGIIKCPIIGSGGRLTEEASDDAAYRFAKHLMLGYKRWEQSYEEWKDSGKKALLFVMCEDTDAADQITRRLNSDPMFERLNGKTINLHTNLKGKVKWKGKGKDKVPEFVESEKDITDEDLQALRKLSRELDSDRSPFLCIVSVLMLREGWDVRNVTTIVPLRPYSSKANILPEQTLGRGLRRMTPPGQTVEVVTVVEHEAFARLNREELAQEGLPIEVVEVDKVPKTTVSIFPDESKENFSGLDIEIPKLGAAYRTLPLLEKIPFEEVEERFKGFEKLPLGRNVEPKIDYEGRQLITDEVVEMMEVDLPLLQNGPGAITYFRRELEHVCKVKNMHQVLAPALQQFIEQLLFKEPGSIYDERIVSRLSDADVREYIRAVFVPLIRERTTETQTRELAVEPMRLAGWRPFQATSSERKPITRARRTVFNLVPCDRGLEQMFVDFLDRAPDIAAFGKNAGPQSLRIDYLSDGSRLAFYTPDFFVRSHDGKCYLIETKGRVDRDVPRKAKAAIKWCESASAADAPWKYLYVPQGVFEKITANRFGELVRASSPALKNLLDEEEIIDELPLLVAMNRGDEEATRSIGVVSSETLKALPSRYRKAAEEAIELFNFAVNKEDFNLASAFTPLLASMDDACKGLIVRGLEAEQPTNLAVAEDWFFPYMAIAGKEQDYYKRFAANLKKTLVYGKPISPIGLLRSCLEYAADDSLSLGGVFQAVRSSFRVSGIKKLLDEVSRINDFRNNRIAHQADKLSDKDVAQKELARWIEGLVLISNYAKEGGAKK